MRTHRPPDAPRRTAPVLVDGKRLLITGVLTPGWIAYAVARGALENGLGGGDAGRVGRWGGRDGVLPAIAFAPADALGGNFLNTPYESAATAFQVSAFSLKELTAGLLPVLENQHASVVTLDFDARVAWPVYDWMGVCKAALESV